MSNAIEEPARCAARPTLRTLQAELAALSRRVEDLEDLRELNQAIERNANKPLVPWAKAKRELGLD